ncbi:MAG TPA: hypothetical protein ENI48_05175 [Thioploca sp.]|nr:hypothetical protein [Thioploca sp.]
MCPCDSIWFSLFLYENAVKGIIEIGSSSALTEFPSTGDAKHWDSSQYRRIPHPNAGVARTKPEADRSSANSVRRTAKSTRRKCNKPTASVKFR